MNKWWTELTSEDAVIYFGSRDNYLTLDKKLIGVLIAIANEHNRQIGVTQ